MKQITFQIDDEAARAFKMLSLNDRRKLETLISIRLIEADKSKKSLKKVMSEISRKAQKRGLTSNILESILNDYQTG